MSCNLHSLPNRLRALPLVLAPVSWHATLQYFDLVAARAAQGLGQQRVAVHANIAERLVSGPVLHLAVGAAITCAKAWAHVGVLLDPETSGPHRSCLDGTAWPAGGPDQGSERCR
jgi:hypothetical protein